MRYLNKIVLINSASVMYSEVILGGNTHFIGTQGVGKSTLLRAILFFYNADTQKLGIKTGQKTFYEHYFPYDNSYIIYEVVKETGNFCILCYKNTGKICFRFFDGNYKKEYFLHQTTNIDNNGNAGIKAYENWEQIKEQFSKNGVISSVKIDRYELYRDILYGNSEGKKEFRKYAFLESKQYQNIPRTIQNVFLNAELKAEFIKETIIKSLNDEDVSISLQIYKSKLQIFKAQYEDILKWNRKDKNGQIILQNQALKIVQMHKELLYLEKEQLQFAKNLIKRIEIIAIENPILIEKIDLEEEKNSILSKELEQLIHIFEQASTEDKITIGIFEKDIKKAKQKEIDYNELNINEIIEKFENKNTLLNRKESLKNQKNLLTNVFSDITLRFEALLRESENQKNSFENVKKAQINTLEEDFLRFKSNKDTAFSVQKKQIGEDNKMLLEDATFSVEEANTTVQNLNNKKAEIRHERYFEVEISNKNKEISDLKKEKISFENEIKISQNILQSKQNEQIAEEKDRRRLFEREIENKNREKTLIQAQIEEITLKINNNTTSFYGWLNENYDGWQHTIGKIIDDKILFDNSLSPTLLEKITSKTTKKLSFYGVELDFSEIKKISKTIAEYEKDKENLVGKIEKINKEIDNQTTVLDGDLKKIKTRFQSKIKELNSKIDLLVHNLEQNQPKQDEINRQLFDVQDKAKTEKTTKTTEIENEIINAKEVLQIAKNAISALKSEIKRQENDLEIAKNKDIDNEKTNVEQQKSNIKAEIDGFKLDFEKKRQEIVQNQHNEFTNKGADTQRIQEIDTEISQIKLELDFIEKNNTIFFEYKKDKREYIDRILEFESKKTSLEKRLILLQNKYHQEKKEQDAKIKIVQESIAELKQSFEIFEADLKAFSEFKTTEIFINLSQKIALKSDSNEFLPNIISDFSENNTKNAREIINKINQKDNSHKQYFANMKSGIMQFYGNFSEDNIFIFKTALSQPNEYLEFAENLKEFLDENKIQQYEIRVNESFGDIILGISKEIEHLMSKSGEIQKTITKINNDFVEKNFVGAIKKIELRYVDSSNKIVLCFRDIAKFSNENNEYPFDNQANTQKDNKNNKTIFSEEINKKSTRAIELLMTLLQSCLETKKEAINLADSFELEFRIAENQNDTGWVSKIDHVGSNGTEVLVKAMINIMLLSVSKKDSTKQFADFQLHCMMDEVGTIHSNNVKGIIQFANERNILLINGSPEVNNATAYKYIYHLKKDEKSNTIIQPLMKRF